MDVNLPFLGTGEANGPSVKNFTITADVGVLAATLPMNNVVSTTKFVPTDVNFSTTSNITQSKSSVNILYNASGTTAPSQFINGNVFETNVNMNTKGSIFEIDADINMNIKGHTSDITESHIGSYINGSIFDTNVDLDMNMKGYTSEKPNNQVGDISIKGYTIEEDKDITVQANTQVYYYNLVYDVLNLLNINMRKPFYVNKIVGKSSHIDKFNIDAESKQEGDIIINGEAVESNRLASVDINVPITSIDNGFIENFTMTGASTILNYISVSPVTSYDVSLSIPINMLGSIKNDLQPELSVEAAVDSTDILLNSDIYDENSVVYKVADIDHGITKGKIKIFPNQWTICFVNKPVNDKGKHETISSFLINKLVEKYGPDIHTKISMIVGKHPETGEEYNFVVQKGYMTPKGSINDFNMCYLRDGVFYPIPFMIQSVSDETLEIDWEV